MYFVYIIVNRLQYSVYKSVLLQQRAKLVHAVKKYFTTGFVVNFHFGMSALIFNSMKTSFRRSSLGAPLSEYYSRVDRLNPHTFD